jgi:hypothetical protein
MKLRLRRDIARRRRIVPLLAAAALLALAPVAAPAEPLETTHLFGFTLGTDVNNVGELEAESETTGRFTRRAGAYTALESTFGVKFIPFENFSVEPEASVAHHDVSGVPGLDDRRQNAFDALTVELRYRVLDREHAPVGLTFGADPHWGRVDDISGEPVDRYGVDFLMAVDRALVADRVFGAVNLIYQPEAARSRVTGMWEHQSDIGVSGGLTVQMRPGVMVGAEARYLRSFDGLGLDAFAGEAVFVGPTFYAKLNDRIWMSAAWSVQVAGHAAGDAAALDLVNFERHQGVLRFGYNF